MELPHPLWKDGGMSEAARRTVFIVLMVVAAFLLLGGLATLAIQPGT
jgi:hypothetical protein